MAEEGSVSLRPRDFTPYRSFIINLHHLGLGELGIMPQTGALFCCSLHTWEVLLSLLLLKRKRVRESRTYYVANMI